MARGRLIAIEGIDGAGKTTLAVALRNALEQRGVQALLLREPGGVELSERIRSLLADPALGPAASTEALLYAAARAQLIHERVLPALERGEWVLLDRYVDSSLAYQGAGRELGIEAVRAINTLATAGLEADRTLLLRISPPAARARLRARAAPPDRLEGEDEHFFARVAAAYEQLARAEPKRIHVLDAERPTGEVLERAIAQIDDLLPRPARHPDRRR